MEEINDHCELHHAFGGGEFLEQPHYSIGVGCGRRFRYGFSEYQGYLQGVPRQIRIQAVVREWTEKTKGQSVFSGLPRLN
jgi:hypothetical protein